MITKHRDNLVPCQRCQERYREDDPMCPHCGYPLPDTRSAEARAESKPAINFNPPPVPPQFAGMQIPVVAASAEPAVSPPGPRGRQSFAGADSRTGMTALAVATVAMGALAIWWFVRSQ